MALRTMAPVFLRRADDDKAFERLYERHVSDVYRYAAAMLGTAADAEDVTQTTFLNAYRAFKSGTRPEKPQSWLIAIAHNVCRQRFRQSQRRPHEVAFDEGIGERGATVESTAPSAEDLRRALSQLQPSQRAAIVMRELEGCSYAEIADVLGISVSALETLLFRARRALREQLEEQLTCQEAAFAINKQLDGRLSLGERRALRAHLRACSECNSLAQSQRAQCRALKALVLVPLPATMSHWVGTQTAAAATAAAGAGGLTAVGATTGGGGAGASSIVFGGVAAKVAAVVVAGAVVGGGTFEGVTRVGHPDGRNPQPPAARVEFASATSDSIGNGSSALTFGTPTFGALLLVEPSVRAKMRALRAVRAARSTPHRAQLAPPGQTVKALAQSTPRSTPPGLVLKATRAATPASAHSQSRSQSTGQSRRRTASHPVRPPTAHAKPKSAKPALPIVPHGRQMVPHGRQTPTDTVPDDSVP
jgi:RNA polymerase sigma factor (sigma-70 family)